MNFSNNELDITLGICAAIIGILAFINEFPDKKYFKIIKSLGFKLILFVLATIVGVWATVKKNTLADAEKANEKLNSQKEQRQNDIVNRELTNQSNAVIVSTFTNALAKYNLKLDSNQKIVLKTVRDSLNGKTTKVIEKTITTDALPDLDISQIQFIKLRNDTIEFKIQIDCKKTAIKNLNLSLKMLLLKQGNYNYIPQLREFITNADFSSNTQHTVDLVNICTLEKSIYQAYFSIKGDYYYNNNKFPFAEIFFYDFKTATFGLAGNKSNLQLLFDQYL